MSFSECVELDAITYRILFKDAFINMMSQSDEGKEYLEQAWCLKQTEPDRESLRKHFNKE